MGLQKIVEFMLSDDLKEKVNGLNVFKDSYRALIGAKTLGGWFTLNFHRGGWRRFAMGLTRADDDMNFYTVKGDGATETETLVETVYNSTGIHHFYKGIKVGSSSYGVQVFGGSGVPALAIGVDGDFYLRKDGNQTDGCIYQKRNGGWAKVL